MPGKKANQGRAKSPIQRRRGMASTPGAPGAYILQTEGLLFLEEEKGCSKKVSRDSPRCSEAMSDKKNEIPGKPNVLIVVPSTPQPESWWHALFSFLGNSYRVKNVFRDAIEDNASQARGESIVKKSETVQRNSMADPMYNMLLSTLEKLKIKKKLRSDSTARVNELVETVMKHMKETDSFWKVKRRRTGSHYENVKISQPDEFDVMLVVPVQSVDVRSYGPEGAYYTVALKNNPRRHLLESFVQEDGKTISANEMLLKFRTEVKKAVRHMEDVEVERKKRACPAVTLWIQGSDLRIGLDIVLGLEVHSSWPSTTQDGFMIDNWLGPKAKKNFKFEPFLLVPKYEGKGNEEMDGVCAKDTWRISFSHVEKEILKNHSSTKTCCKTGGAHCCRKQCLKLLKYLLVQLREKHPKELSKFCSYHAKSMLFHACCQRPSDSEWVGERLSECFQLLLQDFVGCLRDGHLPNFFIPTHNLLGSKPDKRTRGFLADLIEHEINNMFPIFQESL
ncbi:hypothetical protein JZ751_026897 [Albula glossodonta]|uniref:Cyclic GMP-AMP synthase n=1 Tax=Albula glossodonta TaxID=121402 RepID=A0A8T2PH90_9TELE|nr:hypothetical protein JZ751_026897 [Albula glossodonta]